MAQVIQASPSKWLAGAAICFFGACKTQKKQNNIRFFRLFMFRFLDIFGVVVDIHNVVKKEPNPKPGTISMLNN